MLVYVIVLGWLALGLLGSHIGHTTLNRRYPNIASSDWDIPTCLLSILGPINLVGAFFGTEAWRR